MREFLKFWFYLFNWNRIHDHIMMLPFEKRERIAKIAKVHEATVFIETGSFHGETAAFMAPNVASVLSIEIDPEAANLARQRCAVFPNVRIVTGSSESALRTELAGLSGQVLFWLDAHYQVGMTRGRKSCPLFAELDAIFNSAVDPLILIDDARKFIWVNGWPSLESIRRRIPPGYQFRIWGDMIAIGKMSM